MQPEIYKNTSESSFLKTKTAFGEKPIPSTHNWKDGHFIQDAEDALVDLIVTIMENRMKN